MNWLGKLFGSSSSHVDASHPPLPGGKDRFLPEAGVTGFRASVNVSGEHPRTGAVIFRAGAGAARASPPKSGRATPSIRDDRALSRHLVRCAFG
ncbi:MAG: hypothetical protein JWQ44_2329 [Chthoniobacter sp.]|nr:hypothetical protein [Chthoniobacter sp.]